MFSHINKLQSTEKRVSLGHALNSGKRDAEYSTSNLFKLYEAPGMKLVQDIVLLLPLKYK